MHDAHYDYEVESYIEEAGLRRIDERREAAEFGLSIEVRNQIEIWGWWHESNTIEVRNIKTGTTETWRLSIDGSDRRVWYDDFDSPLSTDDLRNRIEKMMEMNND